MPSTLIKIASIGGGLATATGVGVGISYLTSGSLQKLERIAMPQQEEIKEPANISELLKNNNLRLLTDDEKDNSKWEENWKKLTQDNNADVSPKAPWSFKDWKTTRVNTPAQQEFKDECKKHGAGEAIDKNDKTYIAVSTYCSTQLTAEERQSQN